MKRWVMLHENGNKIYESIIIFVHCHRFEWAMWGHWGGSFHWLHDILIEFVINEINFCSNFKILEGVGATASALGDDDVLDIDTTIPLETTWHAMEDLVSMGLVRSIGIRWLKSFVFVTFCAYLVSEMSTMPFIYVCLSHASSSMSNICQYSKHRSPRTMCKHL